MISADNYEDYRKLWALVKSEGHSNDKRILNTMNVQGWCCFITEMENDLSPLYVQWFSEFESFIIVYFGYLSRQREMDLINNQNLMPMALTSDCMNSLVMCLLKWPLRAHHLHESLVHEVSIVAVKLNNPNLLAIMLDLTENLNITVGLNKASLLMYAFKSKSLLAQEMLSLPSILKKQNLYYNDINGYTILDYAYLDENPKFISIFEGIKPLIPSKIKKRYKWEVPKQSTQRPLPVLVSDPKRILFDKIRMKIKTQLASLFSEEATSSTSEEEGQPEMTSRTKFKPV